MFRFVLALLALSLPAQGAQLYFTDWLFEYETADWTDFEFQGEPDDISYSLPGEKVSFDLYLQWEGLVDGVPDGTYSISNTEFGAFHTVYSTPFDRYNFDLTFLNGSLIGWSGLTVYSSSEDGLAISMDGDLYKPFVHNYFSNETPGTWTLLETSQYCFTPDGESCDLPQVPIAPAGVMLASGLLLLTRRSLLHD